MVNRNKGHKFKFSTLNTSLKNKFQFEQTFCVLKRDLC